MARILQLSVRNFRKLKKFDCTFDDAKIVCLIGRGDSGKSSILDAISYVLYPSWNLQVSDYDFTDLDISNSIKIQSVIIDFPQDFLRDDKYGMYLSGYDFGNSKVVDFTEAVKGAVLVVELTVNESLEPKWEIVNFTSKQRTSFLVKDRARLNTCIVSDYINRHFSWGVGSPLSALSRVEGEEVSSDVLLRMVRKVRSESSEESFGDFKEVMGKISTQAANLGFAIEGLSPAFDGKSLSIKEGSVVLHDSRKLPIRLLGKGSRRLLSVAVQMAASNNSGITLIDEVEQGLEPDRVRSFVASLKRRSFGQVIFTTHSDNAVVELDVSDIILVREGSSALRLPKEAQGLVRKSPAVLFGRKVILCEGVTEVGFCMGIDRMIIERGGRSFACSGVVLVDGGGSKFYDYARILKVIGADFLLFCDSDERQANEKKEQLRREGVSVVDWEVGDSFEQAIFRDLPNNSISNLIKLAYSLTPEHENEEERKKAFVQSIAAKVGIDENAIFNGTEFSVLQRSGLAEVAKKNGKWFKSTRGGLSVASIISRAIREDVASLKDTRVLENLVSISRWAGADVF